MAVSDRIELRGLRTTTVIGVLDHERDAAQPIEIDLDVAVDLGAAGRDDDLDATVDYGALTDAVVAVAGRSFALLEALAEAIAAEVLAHGRVSAVEVAVRKLRPPVPHDLATAGVRIVRP